MRRALSAARRVGALSAARRVGALFVAGLGAACAALGGPSATASPPNVLVILVDDLGVEAIGAFGGTSYATPNIDRLAASGMKFTAAHTSPLCTPTRVRVLTGRGAARSYTGFSILHPEERTFANELRDAGYATVAAGKWQLLGAEHYGEEAGRGTHPRDAGFDAWCLWQVEKLGSRFADPQLDRNGQLLTFPGSYGPDVACDYLIDFLRSKRDERWLAFYPMILTHAPFEPTPASVDAHGSKQRNFADMVTYMDALVGRLMDEVDALGLREETMIVFTTDNGSPTSMRSKAWGETIRGGKGKTTDAGTHVPLVISWPGVVEAGAEFGGLVDLLDLAPTFFDACGVPRPTDRVIDGMSLLPELRGDPAPRRDLVTCYYNPRPGNPKFPVRRWARGPRYKLYDDGRFFDVRNDRLEERPLDVDALHAEVAYEHARLRDALDAMPAPRRIATH